MNNYMTIHERLGWILAGSTVLNLSCGPWFLLVESGPDHDIIGRLSNVARVCEVDIIAFVYCESSRCDLTAVDRLQLRSDDRKVLPREQE